MVTIKQNNNSEQVQVCLHMDERTCVKEEPPVMKKSLSNHVIVNALTKTIKDKKNKTTNVPSNCCTAIMMPLTGTRSNSRQFDLFHHQYSDNELSHDDMGGVCRREMTMIKCNGDEACDRYNTQLKCNKRK